MELGQRRHVPLGARLVQPGAGTDIFRAGFSFPNREVFAMPRSRHSDAFRKATGTTRPVVFGLVVCLCVPGTPRRNMHLDDRELAEARDPLE